MVTCEMYPLHSDLSFELPLFALRPLTPAPCTITLNDHSARPARQDQPVPPASSPRSARIPPSNRGIPVRFHTVGPCTPIAPQHYPSSSSPSDVIRLRLRSSRFPAESMLPQSSPCVHSPRPLSAESVLPRSSPCMHSPRPLLLARGPFVALRHHSSSHTIAFRPASGVHAPER